MLNAMFIVLIVDLHWRVIQCVVCIFCIKAVEIKIRPEFANLSFDRCPISHQLKQTWALEIYILMYFTET